MPEPPWHVLSCNYVANENLLRKVSGAYMPLGKGNRGINGIVRSKMITTKSVTLTLNSRSRNRVKHHKLQILRKKHVLVFLITKA